MTPYEQIRHDILKQYFQIERTECSAKVNKPFPTCNCIGAHCIRWLYCDITANIRAELDKLYLKQKVLEL